MFSVGSIWAIGFTVIVKVSGSPVLLSSPFVKDGITVTVVTIGLLLPVLVAVNSISPEPESSNPVSEFVLVHS